MQFKVYLDNDIASGLVNRDLEEEMNLVDLLMQLARNGRVGMTTTGQSLREIERTCNAEKRERLKGVTALVEISRHDHKVLGSSREVADLRGSSVDVPLVTDVTDDRIYSRLRDLGLKDDDAKHLTNATSGGWNYFLTRDSHIFSQRDQIEKIFPSIKIRKPSELLGEVQASGIIAKAGTGV
jgi:predicted nucleic acid-binding protein